MTARHLGIPGYTVAAAPPAYLFEDTFTNNNRTAVSTDDFNRADGTPGISWFIGSGAYTVTSNKLTRSVTGSGNDFASYSMAMGGNPSGSYNMYAEADIYRGGAAQGGSGSAFVAVNVRSSGVVGSANCYMGFWNPTSTNWEIGKVLTGTYSAIATTAGPGAGPAQGDRLRLEAEWSALRLYHNGSLVLSTTDTSISFNSPFAGVNTNGLDGSAVSPPTSFDNFTCGLLGWDHTKWIGQQGGTFVVTGGKGVYTNDGSNPGSVHTDQVFTDAEILVKVEWTLSLVGYPEFGWRRTDSTTSSSSTRGYLIQITGSSGSVNLHQDNYSGVGSVTDAALVSPGVWWFKIRCVGNNHKVKWWPDGSGEPGTWKFDWTDTTPAIDAGYGTFCIRNYGSPDRVLTLHSITITDLASPPTPADGSLRGLWGSRPLYYNPGSLTGSTNLSWCAWVNDFIEDGNGKPFIVLTDGGSNYTMMARNAAGTFVCYMSPSDYSTGHAMAAGTWYFVALSRTSSGTDLYIAQSGTSTLTKYTTTRIGGLAGNIYLLFDNFGTTATNTAITGVKIWQAALTQAELEAEMATRLAVRKTNLFLNYKFNGFDMYDASGNGRTLFPEGGLGSGPVGAPIT